MSKIRDEQAVGRFADAMLGKLDSHADKPSSWEFEEPMALFLHLQDEVEELRREVWVDDQRPRWVRRPDVNRERVLREAADVALLAMMLADAIRFQEEEREAAS